MSQETASLIVYTALAIGFCVWLWGLQTLIHAGREHQRENALASERFSIDENTSNRLLMGGAEVAGRPAELASKTAALLAKEGGNRILGLVKILTKTDDRIIFESLGPTAVNSGTGPGCARSQRREIHFAPLPQERSRIDYVIETSGGNWTLRLGGVFVILGLIALVTVFWVMQSFVLPSPNPAVRFQVFQVLQAGHFLWPPFLFAAVYRRQRQIVRAAMDSMIQNLPYIEA